MSDFFDTDQVTPHTLNELQLHKGPITETECLNASKEFKNDKLPSTELFLQSLEILLGQSDSKLPFCFSFIL